MAGLFSNFHNRPHGRPWRLHFVANRFRSLGLSFADPWSRSFALRSVSNQDNLGLFSEEGQTGWDLKFRSPF
jgi:hypothetical protein